MSPADTTDAVVEDAARRRYDRTCVRGHGNGDDSGCGYRREDDGNGNGNGHGDNDDDGGDEGDVALAIRLVRRDALRRRGREGKGRGGEGVAGALIKADATDDYDCEDQ